MTTIARLIVNSPDDAFALLPLDPGAELVRRLDAEALAVGFRLMDDDECPAEITDDGWLRVSMCATSNVIPDFQSDEEWVAYWAARMPELTADQRRRAGELLRSSQQRREGGRTK